MTMLHLDLLKTTIYCVTKKLQLDNRKFVYEPTKSCYINYRASREKSTQPTENN